MSKHTPGPWRVNPGAKEVRGADWNVIVADVTDEQDARLIAAAPDLLAACSDLVEMSDAGVPCPPRLVVMARAAVAKARGD